MFIGGCKYSQQARVSNHKSAVAAILAESEILKALLKIAPSLNPWVPDVPKRHRRPDTDDDIDIDLSASDALLHELATMP
jgi:hypothetical protein